MKIIKCVIASIMLFVVLTVGVFAQQTNSVILPTSYMHGNTLYGFIGVEDDSATTSELFGQVWINGGNPYQCSFSSVANNTAPVSYLLMIDNSTSMPNYSQQVTAFSNALANSASENTYFAVANFGESFRVVQDFTNNSSLFVDAVSNISYTDNASRIYEGIIEVYNHFDIQQRSKGELLNLIIISDDISFGEQSSSYESAVSRATDRSVIVHTVKVGANSDSEIATETIADFATGLNIEILQDEQNTELFANNIIDYTNSLLAFSVNIDKVLENTNSVNIKMTLQNNEQLVVNGVDIKVFNYIAPQSSMSTENSVDENSLTEQDDIDSNVVEAQQDEEEAQNSSILLYIATAVAAIIVVFIVMLIIVRFRRKRKNKLKTNNGIEMKLQVISGNMLNKQSIYCLVDELTIGKNKKCNIIVKDKFAADINAKIYFLNNFVYIVDLHSSNGTYLEDIRIYEPNRLRSGDVITVGQTKFYLEF